VTARPALPESDGSDFEAVLGFERVSWRRGYVLMRVILQPLHRNRQGLVHGGVLSALLDAAGMFAGNFNPETGTGRAAVTVATSCQFTGTTKGDVIEAEGTLIRAGRALYFAEARITDPETGGILANGQGTYKYR